MNVGAAAQKSSLPLKTIGYQEDIGLLTADRGANGYWDCSSEDVHSDPAAWVSQSRSAACRSPSTPTATASSRM